MQETTFKAQNFATIYSWLDALYASQSSGASQKILLQNLDSMALTQISSTQKLQNKLEYTFKNQDYLINALTQSTFCYEYKDLAIVSNERMEFLGDSLVNLVVGKVLYKKFPHLSEGDLSKLRGSLVNEHSLAKLAKSLALGENLLLGKGEHKNHGQKKESILADAFEAVFAAIYIDSDESLAQVEKSLLIVIEHYEKTTKTSFFAVENLESFDSKTQLQEISMELFKILPTYKSTEIKNGFKVEVWINEKKLAEAEGPSKKKLEKELARIVLDEKRYQ